MAQSKVVIILISIWMALKKTQVLRLSEIEDNKKVV